MSSKGSEIVIKDEEWQMEDRVKLPVEIAIETKYVSLADAVPSSLLASTSGDQVSIQITDNDIRELRDGINLLIDMPGAIRIFSLNGSRAAINALAKAYAEASDPRRFDPFATAPGRDDAAPR